MKLNIQNTKLEVTAGLSSQFPTKKIPRIAFTGRSNVGKSSLINTLLGRKSLARVSSTPGKTITVNYYNVDNALYIVDLPGYGFAKRAPADIKRWSALTDGFFTERSSSELLSGVVALVDLKVGLTKDDMTMLDYMNQCGINYVIAATKCDKLNKGDMAKNLAAIRSCPLVSDGTDIIPFSSLKGIGKDEIWNAIFKLTEG